MAEKADPVLYYRDAVTESGCLPAQAFKHNNSVHQVLMNIQERSMYFWHKIYHIISKTFARNMMCKSVNISLAPIYMKTAVILNFVVLFPHINIQFSSTVCLLILWLHTVLTLVLPSYMSINIYSIFISIMSIDVLGTVDIRPSTDRRLTFS